MECAGKGCIDSPSVLKHPSLSQQLIITIRKQSKKRSDLFHRYLGRATSWEYMEYLSQIDFAVDGSVNISAMNTYPDNQARVVNGYMLVWRQHILTMEEVGNM